MHDTAVANPQSSTAASPGWGLVLILAALLAAQIALALVLGLRGTGQGVGARDTPLLTFDPAAVQRIRIEQRGSDALLLERADQGWQVQSLSGFPAPKTRVEALLERLAGLKRGLPVATSDEALARLKVADGGPEGRLSLEGGSGELAALLIGDAAGARRRYVRAAGDGAVLEVEISPTDITAKADDWADRSLLNLEQTQIQHIELPGVRLEKAEGGWRLADIKEGEALDQPKAEDLARRLGSLSFVSVLGADNMPEYGQDAPALEWRVGLASGDTLSYRLSRLKADEDQEAAAKAAEGESAETPKPKGPEWYVLKVSDRPHYLKVASYTAEGLVGTTREGLLVKPQAGPEETPPEGPTAAPGQPEQPVETGTEPSPIPLDEAKTPGAEAAQGPR